MKPVNNDKTPKIAEYQYMYGQRLSGNSMNINMTQTKGTNEVINELITGKLGHREQNCKHLLQQSVICYYFIAVLNYL